MREESGGGDKEGACLLSMTLHSCFQTSRLRSKGVSTSLSFSCSRASLRRHSKKPSLSLSSSCSGVVLESHCGLGVRQGTGRGGKVWSQWQCLQQPGVQSPSWNAKQVSAPLLLCLHFSLVCSRQQARRHCWVHHTQVETLCRKQISQSDSSSSKIQLL